MSSTLSSSAGPDRVDRPHIVWWIVVLGGLGLLALIGFSQPFYDSYSAAVHELPARKWMAWLFIGCIPIHIFEGVFALRLARRIGLVQSAVGWAWQCFFLGYPSTRLLLARSRAAAGSKG